MGNVKIYRGVECRETYVMSLTVGVLSVAIVGICTRDIDILPMTGDNTVGATNCVSRTRVREYCFFSPFFSQV